MWARGVCDVVGAAEIIKPVMEYGGYERKHASEAPAGPAPTMRRGVSMTSASGADVPLLSVECGMMAAVWLNYKRIQISLP